MNQHIRIATIGSILTRKQATRNYVRLCGVYAKWVDGQRLPYYSADELLLHMLSKRQVAWLIKFVDIWERATSL